MENLSNEIQDFIEKIKQSETYKNYAKSKKVIESKPSLNEKLNDFRKDSFEIQLNSNYGQYSCYEQILQLKNGNDELLSDIFVKEFMEDEFKMSKLILKIFNSLVEELDFNVDFLE